MKLYIVRNHMNGKAKFCTTDLKILKSKEYFYEEIDFINTKEQLKEFEVKDKIKHLEFVLDKEEIELVKKYL